MTELMLKGWSENPETAALKSAAVFVPNHMIMDLFCLWGIRQVHLDKFFVLHSKILLKMESNVPRNMFGVVLFENHKCGTLGCLGFCQQQQGFFSEVARTERSAHVDVNGTLIPTLVSTQHLEAGLETEAGLVEKSASMIVKDKLEPSPVSTVRLEPGLETEPQAEPATAISRKNGVMQPQSEPTTSKSRQRRHSKSARIDRVMQPQQSCDQASTCNNEPPVPATTRELSFRLFKIARASEEYILEVEASELKQYHLSVHEENEGTWRVKKSCAPKRGFELEPIVETYPPIFKKECDLPLQERLKGWTVTTKQRRSGTTDKTYHRMRKPFRSLVEASTYILYSSFNTELVPFRTERSQEEAEAIEVLLMMSSSTQAGHPENLNIGSSRKEREFSFSSRGVQIEKQSDVDDNRSANPEPGCTCKGKALPVAPVEDSLEKRKNELQETGDEVIETLSRSPEDDIFANFMEIEDLNVHGQQEKEDRAIEAICLPPGDDIFFSPELENWDLYGLLEMENEAIQTLRFPPEDNIFASLSVIEKI